MKILIAGIGKIGIVLTRQLSSEGYDLTVIDNQDAVLEETVEQYDVLAVKGNCASRDVLLNAGVEDADLLIAATGADEVNLLSCLTAHGINEKIHTIARIRNPDYSEQIYLLSNQFGLSMAVNPEKYAAVEAERVLRYPGFLKREPFAKGRFELVELRVEAESPLENLLVRDFQRVTGCKTLICSVLRDGKAISPTGEFYLRSGDRIFVTAPTDTLAKLLKSIGVSTKRVKRVIIAGGSKTSFYLAQSLTKTGMQVLLIEKDLERCRQFAEQLNSNITVLHGDPSDLTLLEKEGIHSADAVVCMTDTDELNLIISLYANSIDNCQVLTQLKQINASRLINELDIGSVICPQELCSNTIVRYVRALNNQTGAAISVHSIADGQAEAVEFLVDENTKYVGIALKELKFKPNILIAGICRGTQTEVPSGNSYFQNGDTLIVVSSENSVIYHINDIFAS